VKWGWMEEGKGGREVFVWCFWFSYNISSFVSLCCFGLSGRLLERKQGK
jgi:hypothetical protein